MVNREISQQLHKLPNLAEVLSFLDEFGLSTRDRRRCEKWVKNILRRGDAVGMTAEGLARAARIAIRENNMIGRFKL